MFSLKYYNIDRITLANITEEEKEKIILILWCLVLFIGLLCLTKSGQLNDSILCIYIKRNNDNDNDNDNDNNNNNNNNKCTWSQLSQRIFDRVIFRTSASWASVNLMSGLLFSYQNRSHFRRFRNWIPMMHANVGPTRPPWRGVSARPPFHK